MSDGITLTQDYMTYKRNADWMVIVRLMRKADEGDKAAFKRLKEDYEIDYKPKATIDTVKAEIIEAITNKLGKK